MHILHLEYQMPSSADQDWEIEFHHFSMVTETLLPEMYTSYTKLFPYTFLKANSFLLPLFLVLLLLINSKLQAPEMGLMKTLKSTLGLVAADLLAGGPAPQPGLCLLTDKTKNKRRSSNSFWHSPLLDLLHYSNLAYSFLFVGCFLSRGVAEYYHCYPLKQMCASKILQWSHFFIRASVGTSAISHPVLRNTPTCWQPLFSYWVAFFPLSTEPMTLVLKDITMLETEKNTRSWTVCT